MMQNVTSKQADILEKILGPLTAGKPMEEVTDITSLCDTCDEGNRK